MRSVSAPIVAISLALGSALVAGSPALAADGKALDADRKALDAARAALAADRTALDAAGAALAAFADAELAKSYAADAPGAAVLVRWHGETVLRKGYGLADLDFGIPVAPDQVFEIGSVTKQFTAAALLRLAEAGKLSLDDPLAKFLPDFPTGGATVTLEQLLHHTAGVPSYTDMPEWLPRWREDMTLDTLIGLFRGKQLDFPPGTFWNYSNSGYVLLGAVIEKVSGKSYEDFVEQELFAPLGLDATRYGHQEEVVRGRARGYQKGAGGWENAPYLSLTQPYAAGSLLSNVDDLARWSDALEAGRVVSPASRDRMFAPAILRGGDQDGVSTRYGLGNATTTIAGHGVHLHGGGIHGFAAMLMRVPDEDLVIVILTNNPTSSPAQLARTIAGRALGEQAPATVELAAAALDDYPGVYRVPGSETDRRWITREGSTLRLQRTGGSLFPLQPLGGDRFRIEGQATTVAFSRSGGRVVALSVDDGYGPVFRSARTDEALPAERAVAAVDPALLDGLVGVYALAPGFDLEVTRDGDRLFSRATGQESFEIFPASPTRWFLKVVDAELEFVVEHGRATSLVLHQGGQDVPAPRKP